MPSPREDSGQAAGNPDPFQALRERKELRKLLRHSPPMFKAPWFGVFVFLVVFGGLLLPLPISLLLGAEWQSNGETIPWTEGCRCLGGYSLLSCSQHGRLLCEQAWAGWRSFLCRV